MTDQDDEEGEDTKRVKRVLHAELNGSMQTVKKIQFWMTLVVIVFIGGASTILFLARYATESDLEKVSNGLMDTKERVIRVESSIGEQKARSDRIDDKVDRIGETMYRVAIRVGAPALPPPAPTPKPALPDRSHP